jgi:hypothetical protein
LSCTLLGSGLARSSACPRRGWRDFVQTDVSTRSVAFYIVLHPNDCAVDLESSGKALACKQDLWYETIIPVGKNLSW